MLGKAFTCLLMYFLSLCLNQTIHEVQDISLPFQNKALYTPPNSDCCFIKTDLKNLTVGPLLRYSPHKVAQSD